MRASSQPIFGSYIKPRVGYAHTRTPNPTSEPTIEAMETNNATTAYFIIEKPRLGTQGYNRIKSQAQQNNLQTYKVFYYTGEEKLRIFYYQKEMDV